VIARDRLERAAAFVARPRALLMSYRFPSRSISRPPLLDRTRTSGIGAARIRNIVTSEQQP